MVIEKLKEWQDKKEDREDQQILNTIDRELKILHNDIVEMHKKIREKESDMTELFRQWYLIK
jgi:hypothetical protein